MDPLSIKGDPDVTIDPRAHHRQTMDAHIERGGVTVERDHASIGWGAQDDQQVCAAPMADYGALATLVAFRFGLTLYALWRRM